MQSGYSISQLSTVHFPLIDNWCDIYWFYCETGWPRSRVVSVLDSGTEGPGLKSQPSNSLEQTVHTHRASVYQAAKLVAALLRVARVTAGLAESNGSLPPGLWFTSPAGWLPRTGISSGTICSAIEYRLPFIVKLLLYVAIRWWLLWALQYAYEQSHFRNFSISCSDIFIDDTFLDLTYIT